MAGKHSEWLRTCELFDVDESRLNAAADALDAAEKALREIESGEDENGMSICSGGMIEIADAVLMEHFTDE